MDRMESVENTDSPEFNGYIYIDGDGRSINESQDMLHRRRT
jgi:hypothetical protein